MAKLQSVRHRIRREAAGHVKTYDAKLDSKRRLVLRSAKYDHYHVYEREDGSLILTPKILVDAPLSKETLKLVERSVKNLKKGKASAPVDIDKYLISRRRK
jgi:hypothetical protein